MKRELLEKMLNLAVEHHKAGNPAMAAALYAEIRSVFPKLFDGWYLAGVLEVHCDRPLNAIPLLAEALRIDPSSAPCTLFFGMALADAGRHADAELPLRVALNQFPQFAEAWENLATVLTTLGKVEEAQTCLQRVLDLQPGREDIRARLAESAPLASTAS